ncbi:MAG TPA: DEAD/DEAH box helicase [Cyclobacteriaceae bacterium]|nr:DEAD/DEAH box helicase [Cyclobacteriaceae bacterium]
MPNEIIKIDLQGDKENSNLFFSIKGNLEQIFTNRRLMLSLNRMGCLKGNTEILVPYKKNNQATTLQNIQKTFERFKVDIHLSEKLISEVETFHREDELFEEFSNKAVAIRNNEFDKYPKLIKDFEQFESTLKRDLRRKLYPLQLLSAFHMAFAQNACNFAVPGAGKTSIVYGAYSYLKSLPSDDPKRVDRLLVIGPLSSFAPWENEFEECFGKKIKSQRLSGNLALSRERKEEHLYSSNPAELTLIYHGGVNNLQQQIIDFLKSNKVMVVVDEAHRIKNPDGVWGRSVVEISKEAKSRIVLTGTPVPNGYEDLYNLYQFIYPFKFKSILGFHYANLCELTAKGDPESERVKLFTENISPFFIRIKKSDLNLPPIKEKVILVEMNSHQREIYDFIESKYVAHFKTNTNGSIKDVLNKAKLIRLRQASTNPSLLAKPLIEALLNNPELGEVDPNSSFTEDSDEFINDSEFFSKVCNYESLETPQKFIQTKDLVISDILSRNEKVIIWTIFIRNAKDLQTYLSKNHIESRLLIGETDQSVREEIIREFNDPKKNEFSVIIANPFAVAESISLHRGCHNAIYLERDYNCSNFIQSKDRIHRVGLPIGQITTYYYIISSNSIDTVIDERLKLKIQRMEAIINEEIPLFNQVNDGDETDLIKALILDYAQRT